MTNVYPWPLYHFFFINVVNKLVSLHLLAQDPNPVISKRKVPSRGYKEYTRFKVLINLKLDIGSSRLSVNSRNFNFNSNKKEWFNCNVGDS